MKTIRDLELKVKRLTKTALLPEKNNPSDAGFDVFSDEEIEVSDNVCLISTGIAIEIPEGYYGRLKGRSGLTAKTNLRVHEGTIDSGYRGEVKVMVQAHGGYSVERGDKIAQLIIQPLPDIEVLEVDELSDTDRGSKGFGSSGIKKEIREVING